MKRFRRLPFRARRRATAAIVGAVILFVMLFTVGTGYFISINNANLLYAKSLATRTQGMQSVGYESLTVTAVLSSNHIKFYASNTGSLPVNITAAFVLDSSGNVLNCLGVGIPVSSSCYYSTTALSMVVNMGQTSSTIDTGYTYVSGTVTVKVLTARGNVFSGAYPSGGSAQVALIAQSVGSLYIVQGSFKFYYASSYARGDGYPAGGYFGYVVPGSTTIAFAIQMTNSDPSQRAVTINAKSLVTLADNGVPSDKTFYLLQSISDSQPYTSGVSFAAYTTPMTIGYGQTTTLYFGATQPGGTNTQNTLAANQPVGVFLLMYGTYSDSTAYSQTIPFEATYVTGATITSATTSGCAGSTSNTANLQSNTWSSAPDAYFVNNGVSTKVTVGTPTTSLVTFSIPPGTAQGYYQIYLSDTINQAYLTYRVTC